MNEANCKDTQITLTEAVLVPSYLLYCKDILRNNKLEEF